MSDLWVTEFDEPRFADQGYHAFSWGDMRKATPADLVVAVRRGVESGTIEGEVVWRCETHGGSLFTGDEGVCEAAEGDLQPYEYGDEDGEPNCAGRETLAIPVDGEET